MLNVNDIHHYPLRAAELLQSFDEVISRRRTPAVAACGSGGSGGSDGGDEAWKQEIMALLRATHAMVAELTDMERRRQDQRPRSRGSAGERPLAGVMTERWRH
jgi:hypothetical protein